MPTSSLRSTVQIQVAHFTVSLRLHLRRCLDVSARRCDAASRLLFPRKPRRPSAEAVLRHGADGAASRRGTFSPRSLLQAETVSCDYVFRRRR